MYTVYKHTAPNRKVYIGITSLNPNERWKTGKGYTHNEYFTNAIQKYGWDNFTHEIVCEGLSKEEAEQMEIDLIAKYKSNQRKFGYNISNGGECIGKHSEESKLKMSLLKKGKPLSKEHVAKIVESNKRNVNAKRGKPWLGKHLSKEHCEKIKNSQHSKKVLQIDVNGNVVNTFKSINEAARSLNLNQSNICKCCNGIYKTVGGFIWEYESSKVR